jgi:hypothetical protein
MAQHRFYGVFAELDQLGKTPEVISVSPFVGAAQPSTPSEASQKPAPIIEGPGVVTIGTLSEQFVAEQEPSQLLRLSGPYFQPPWLPSIGS